MNYRGVRVLLGFTTLLHIAVPIKSHKTEEEIRTDPYAPTHRRRLNEDFEPIPPYANEIKIENVGDQNTAIEVSSAWKVNYEPGRRGRDRRRLSNSTSSSSCESCDQPGKYHYFGDDVDFYDGAGNHLGFRSLFTTDKDNVNETAVKAFSVGNSSFLPNKGGILCITGDFPGIPNSDFVRTLAYGEVSVTRLSATGGYVLCRSKPIDESTRDDTGAVPGKGQSYQRRGTGLLPEDFSWTVASETLGRVNVGQSYPVCSSLCREGILRNKYSVRKKGIIFRGCRDRCLGNFWVRLHKTFLGWECGSCDELGEEEA